MIDVLCIGQYDRTGKFDTVQWKYFVEWCKMACNGVIVYSRMTYRVLCEAFPLYCRISILEKPDEALDIYAYKINVKNIAFWDYIMNYNYDIDRLEHEISHIFFYSGEKVIASLEVEDCDNYVSIEEESWRPFGS